MATDSSGFPSILLVENDPSARSKFYAVLKSRGYEVTTATCGSHGIDQAIEDNPTIIVINCVLPDMDVVEFVNRIREWSLVPIIVLCGRDQEGERIELLDAGADVCLPTLVSEAELAAYVRVAARQRGYRGLDNGGVLSIGDLQLDLSRRIVTLRGERLDLTPIEYKLLALFARNAGSVLTHQQILEEVWGPSSTDNTQYVRVYVTHLRAKIENDPVNPTYILTETGVGYRFREADS